MRFCLPLHRICPVRLSDMAKQMKTPGRYRQSPFVRWSSRRPKTSPMCGGGVPAPELGCKLLQRDHISIEEFSPNLRGSPPGAANTIRLLASAMRGVAAPEPSNHLREARLSTEGVLYGQPPPRLGMVQLRFSAPVVLPRYFGTAVASARMIGVATSPDMVGNWQALHAAQQPDVSAGRA